MNYVENAIRRALAEVGDRYEAKMYWLATIVSGAPFLGLLGTVWGVMDAFGTMDAGGATIEHLAPVCFRCFVNYGCYTLRSYSDCICIQRASWNDSCSND